MLGAVEFGPSSNIEGFWGPVTSSIDWCEQNYVYTTYVAEFWNTLSSFAISFWALIGIVICTNLKLEWRFYFLYAATCLVGLGSAFFHGTLLYIGQMCDELPMIWFIMMWGYILIQLKVSGSGTLLILAGLLYSFFISVVHYQGAYVTAFQVHFGILVFFCCLKILFLFKEQKKPVHSKFPLISAGCMILAFSFWLADQWFCEQFSKSFNPQGHAIWHVLNSFVIHFGVQYTIALRFQNQGYETKTEYYFFMPFIIPKRKMIKPD